MTHSSLARADFNLPSRKTSAAADHYLTEISDRERQAIDITPVVVARQRIDSGRRVLAALALFILSIGSLSHLLGAFLSSSYDLLLAIFIFLCLAWVIWAARQLFIRSPLWSLYIYSLFIIPIGLAATSFLFIDPIYALPVFVIIIYQSFKTLKCAFALHSSEEIRRILGKIAKIDKQKVNYQAFLRSKYKSISMTNELKYNQKIYIFKALSTLLLILLILLFIFKIFLQFSVYYNLHSISDKWIASSSYWLLMTFGRSVQESLFWPSTATVRFYLVSIIIMIPLGFFTLRVKQYRALDAQKLRLVDPRPPILLLRAFADDNKVRMQAPFNVGRFFTENLLFTGTTFERLVSERTQTIGPVIALGEPGSGLPPLGAGRAHYSDLDWRDAVQHLIVEARLILLVVSNSASFLWEFNQICERGLLSKALLLLPPRLNRDSQDHWSGFLNSVENEVVRNSLAKIDPMRTLLILFDKSGIPRSIIAQKRNHWYYEVALDQSLDLLDLLSENEASDTPTMYRAKQRIITFTLVAVTLVSLAALPWIGEKLRIRETDWWRQMATELQNDVAADVVRMASEKGPLSIVLKERPDLARRLELKAAADIARYSNYGRFPELQGEVRTLLRETIVQIGQRSSDAAILEIIDAKIDLLKALAKQNPEKCVSYIEEGTIYGDSRELRVLEEAMGKAYKEANTLPPNPIVADNEAFHLLQEVSSGPDPFSDFEIEILNNGSLASVDAELLCQVFVKFYSNLVALPPSDAADVVRYQWRW